MISLWAGTQVDCEQDRAVSMIFIRGGSSIDLLKWKMLKTGYWQEKGLQAYI